MDCNKINKSDTAQNFVHRILIKLFFRQQQIYNSVTKERHLFLHLKSFTMNNDACHPIHIRHIYDYHLQSLPVLNWGCQLDLITCIAQMWPIATDGTVWSVCVFGITVSPAKMVEQINIPFGDQIRMG